MKMIDEDEELYDFDENVDEKKHQNFLDKIFSINKAQQLKKPSRTEPTLKISEFDLVNSVTGKKGSVHLDDLTKVLNTKRSHVKIKKKLEGTKKIAKTLPKPLEKPTADRIRRTVAYEKARLDLDRWEPVVTSNRVSSNLQFPLVKDTDLVKEDITEKWRLKTIVELEEEKKNPQKIEEIHVDVEKEKFPMTMKELMEFRKEAAKLRAHQSYKEAKARRQNKIKSKKYHRIQRREKIKQQLKEFEQLQKTDPEEALKRLEEIERVRAQERFSLRHKSTGKWAKNKQIRAKYDKESRQELAQQLALSKELTQKINNGSDSEDDKKLPDEVPILNSTEKDNPWLDNMKVDKEVKDFVEGYRKFWLEKNDVVKDIDNNEELAKEDKHEINRKAPSTDNTKRKVDKKTTRRNKKMKLEVLDSSFGTWEVEEENIDAAFDKIEKTLESEIEKKIKNIQDSIKMKSMIRHKSNKMKVKDKKNLLELPLQKKVPRIDEKLLENVDNETDNDLKNLKNILQNKGKEKNDKKPNDPNIDPNKYIKSKKPVVLETEIPDISTNLDDDVEEDNINSSQRDLIAEAFQDDDLLEEFSKEKSEEIDKDKPKDVNLLLPGWGSWGGSGIVPSKRKRKRFIVKAPKKLPRRDDNKGFLIINENATKGIKEHMVDELPFPFQRVKDFEASIRAPIGRSFVPETAFQRLIKPSVETKIGTIIEPMDKDVLINET